VRKYKAAVQMRKCGLIKCATLLLKMEEQFGDELRVGDIGGPKAKAFSQEETGQFLKEMRFNSEKKEEEDLKGEKANCWRLIADRATSSLLESYVAVCPQENSISETD
jgi:hypothetical protein